MYCFITPKDGFSIDDKVKAELKKLVREKIAPFAMPDYIQVRIISDVVGDYKKYKFDFFFKSFEKYK